MDEDKVRDGRKPPGGDMVSDRRWIQPRSSRSTDSYSTESFISKVWAGGTLSHGRE
jgi:hypothetical protein